MARMIHKIISKVYLGIFSRNSFQKTNDLIIQLALKARGYNNCCDGDYSGENYLIDLLAKKNLRYIIDIGANEGNYSKSLLTKTNSKVIAFEPQISCSKNLDLIKSQFADRFNYEILALSNVKGEVNLYFGKEGSELASLSSEINQIEYVGKSNVNITTTKTTTLDEYIQEHDIKSDEIDFVKIDVEGFEREVLEGMSNLLTIHPPKFIQIEHNQHHLFRSHSMLNFGEILNAYECYQILIKNRGLIKRDLKDSLSNIHLYSNFLFVRKDVGI